MLFNLQQGQFGRRRIGGAAAQPIQYGSFTGPASVTTQDVTGLGYTPSLVLMWCNERTAAGSAGTGAAARMYFGAAVPGGNKWSIACLAEEVGTPDTRSGFRSDYALMGLSDTTDAQNGLIDTLTGITDGFRVNWTVSSSAIVQYLAFPPALSVHVGTFDSGTSTGTQDITAPGFQPSLVLFGSSISNNTEGVAAGGSFSIGAGSSAAARAALNGYLRDGSSLSRGQASASKVIVQTNGASNVLDIDYNGTVSGGFQIDVATAPASSTRVGYVAVAGSGFSAIVGTFASPTSLGTQAYTGAGFAPTALLTFGRGNTSLDSLLAACQLAIGAGTSSSNRGALGMGVVGAAGGDTAQFLSTSRIFGAQGGASGSPDQLADLVSFDADGFTLDWTSVTASATYNGYIAMRYNP